jgi:hypothetical protein
LAQTYFLDLKKPDHLMILCLIYIKPKPRILQATKPGQSRSSLSRL